MSGQRRNTNASSNRSTESHTSTTDANINFESWDSDFAHGQRYWQNLEEERVREEEIHRMMNTNFWCNACGVSMADAHDRQDHMDRFHGGTVPPLNASLRRRPPPPPSSSLSASSNSASSSTSISSHYPQLLCLPTSASASATLPIASCSPAKGNTRTSGGTGSTYSQVSSSRPANVPSALSPIHGGWGISDDEAIFQRLYDDMIVHDDEKLGDGRVMMDVSMNNAEARTADDEDTWTRRDEADRWMNMDCEAPYLGIEKRSWEEDDHEPTRRIEFDAPDNICSKRESGEGLQKKMFRCPIPGCLASYRQKKGLEYHLNQAKRGCIFKRSEKSIKRSESKAKEAEKAKQKSIVKRKKIRRKTKDSEESSSPGISSSSSSKSSSTCSSVSSLSESAASPILSVAPLSRSPSISASSSSSHSDPQPAHIRTRGPSLPYRPRPYPDQSSSTRVSPARQCQRPSSSHFHPAINTAPAIGIPSDGQAQASPQPEPPHIQTYPPTYYDNWLATLPTTFGPGPALGPLSSAPSTLSNVVSPSTATTSSTHQQSLSPPPSVDARHRNLMSELSRSAPPSTLSTGSSVNVDFGHQRARSVDHRNPTFDQLPRPIEDTRLYDQSAAGAAYRALAGLGVSSASSSVPQLPNFRVRGNPAEMVATAAGLIEASRVASASRPGASAFYLYAFNSVPLPTASSVDATQRTMGSTHSNANPSTPPAASSLKPDLEAYAALQDESTRIKRMQRNAQRN